MDIPFQEVTGGFGDKALLDDGSTVGEVQLKYVSSGFNINTNCYRIESWVVLRHIYLVILFAVARHPGGQFDSPSHP